MKISAETQKIYHADVVVVGGGTAGVFAAIAAAKTGANTMLIEKNSILGGTVTVANVNFPGLFFAWGKQIIDGPCWESIQRTIDLGGAEMPEIGNKPAEKHWLEQIRVNRFIYTAVLFQMCEEAGVKVLCNSMVSAVTESEDGVSIVITEKSGLSVILAKNAIDATGDANLVQIAGYAVEKSPVQQPATLQVELVGYCKTNLPEKEIREAFAKEDFPYYLSAEKVLSFLRIGKVDLHIPCTDADTSAGKTALDRAAFSDVLKLYTFFKNIKGLENLEIELSASETGVREINRIVGEKTITETDYINGFHYDDSICYAFYPIDLHVLEGLKQKHHQEGIVSEIPYGALIPKHAKHILCAGRCIASDTYANSAVRVEATCMATGQAAGCAAALAAKENQSVQTVSYTSLCNALKEISAIVPKQ